MSDTGVNEWLKQIYNEFDLHCQRTNTDYSIECDEPNVQSYRISKTNDIIGFLHYIIQWAKDFPIDIEVNDQPIKSGDIDSSEFNIPPRKGGTLLKFMVRPIQETGMSPLKPGDVVQFNGVNVTVESVQGSTVNIVWETGYDVHRRAVNEDQLKFPNNRHGRIQAAWPSSFRKHKTRDTYENSKGKKKKKKAKNESFEQKLDVIINETVGVVLTQPNILFTKNSVAAPVHDVRSTLEETKQNIENTLKKLVVALEQSDEDEQIVIEELIEDCTSQLSRIKSLIDHGTPQANNLS